MMELFVYLPLLAAIIALVNLRRKKNDPQTRSAPRPPTDVTSTSPRGEWARRLFGSVRGLFPLFRLKEPRNKYLVFGLLVGTILWWPWIAPFYRYDPQPWIWGGVVLGALALWNLWVEGTWETNRFRKLVNLYLISGMVMYGAMQLALVNAPTSVDKIVVDAFKWQLNHELTPLQREAESLREIAKSRPLTPKEIDRLRALPQRELQRRQKYSDDERYGVADRTRQLYGYWRGLTALQQFALGGAFLMILVGYAIRKGNVSMTAVFTGLILVLLVGLVGYEGLRLLTHMAEVSHGHAAPAPLNYLTY